MDFTKGQVDTLTEDVKYLQDEAEALKYVIHSIPYKEKPGGKESIIEMIGLIDFAQKEFYRPLIESSIGLKNGNNAIIEDYRAEYKWDAGKYDNVENLLDKIIKHRAALLSTLVKMSVIDWDKKAYIKNRPKSVFQLVAEMVEFERNQLKQIADRVMTIQNDRNN